MNYVQQVECSVQRLRDSAEYLMTIRIPTMFSVDGCTGPYPQAHAVVDDFGTLIITRGWQ